jgi:hypothetical protein
MDAVAPQIFLNVFNSWAAKLLQSGLGVASPSSPGMPRDNEELEALKM